MATVLIFCKAVFALCTVGMSVAAIWALFRGLENFNNVVSFIDWMWDSFDEATVRISIVTVLSVLLGCFLQKLFHMWRNRGILKTSTGGNEIERNKPVGVEVGTSAASEQNAEKMFEPSKGSLQFDRHKICIENSGTVNLTIEHRKSTVRSYMPDSRAEAESLAIPSAPLDAATDIRLSALAEIDASMPLSGSESPNLRATSHDNEDNKAAICDSFSDDHDRDENQLQKALQSSLNRPTYSKVVADETADFPIPIALNGSGSQYVPATFLDVFYTDGTLIPPDLVNIQHEVTDRTQRSVIQVTICDITGGNRRAQASTTASGTLNSGANNAELHELGIGRLAAHSVLNGLATQASKIVLDHLPEVKNTGSPLSAGLKKSLPKKHLKKPFQKRKKKACVLFPNWKFALVNLNQTLSMSNEELAARSGLPLDTVIAVRNNPDRIPKRMIMERLAESLMFRFEFIERGGMTRSAWVTQELAHKRHAYLCAKHKSAGSLFYRDESSASEQHIAWTEYALFERELQRALEENGALSVPASYYAGTDSVNGNAAGGAK